MGWRRGGWAGDVASVVVVKEVGGEMHWWRWLLCMVVNSEKRSREMFKD